MDQRLQFVTDALSDRFTMTELCERYGDSRRIGYKWLARFTEDGKRGLADRSYPCPRTLLLPISPAAQPRRRSRRASCVTARPRRAT
jgi:hypothetical protein